MVLLLVDQAAHRQRRQRIKQQQQMELHGRNRAVQHDRAHVLDRAVHRIAEEQPLDRRGIAIHRVEDGGHVHQQHGEHVIQILNVPEEHEQRREDEAHADVEEHETQDRIEDRDKFPGEGHPVDRRKQEEHQQRQAEVDHRRDVLGQQEDVLGHVDLGEDVLVGHQGVHAAGGRLAVIAEHQVAREQIRRVMLHVAAEKLREHQPHHQQRQQRGQNAPSHAQHRTLVLLLEVALDQFLEEELVLFHSGCNFVHDLIPHARTLFSVPDSILSAVSTNTPACKPLISPLNCFHQPSLLTKYTFCFSICIHWLNVTLYQLITALHIVIQQISTELFYYSHWPQFLYSNQGNRRRRIGIFLANATANMHTINVGIGQK